MFRASSETTPTNKTHTLHSNTNTQKGKEKGREKRKRGEEKRTKGQGKEKRERERRKRKTDHSRALLVNYFQSQLCSDAKSSQPTQPIPNPILGDQISVNSFHEDVISVQACSSEDSKSLNVEQTHESSGLLGHRTTTFCCEAHAKCQRSKHDSEN